MSRPSHYQQRISELTDRDPRHVEAWMRLEHGTLDALTPAQFDSEVLLANACVMEAGVRESESLALSYGL